MAKTKTSKNKLSASDSQALLKILKARFEKNTQRHKGLDWAKVQAKLESDLGKLWSLEQMESSGGEPDVVDFDKKTGEFTFFDCSPETPAGRRSFCYDHEALESRKEHKPKDSAVNAAEEMGVELLDEAQYHQLQALGNFDTKTSSWLKTPPEIRKLGGSIFGDRRFGRVFIYHNGAESYYAGRGFRCYVKV
jgi:hypothetical protein